MSGRSTAYDSLDALALGDAFGKRYHAKAIRARVLLPGPWTWTDDTAMALSVYEVLAERGEIDQDRLAASFAQRYDPARKYGPSMRRALPAIASGRPWAEVTRETFGGEGSFGNGAAMRVAPVGAWFADDLDTVAEQAARSSVVTHSHPEGVAGAVAVALAAALFAASRGGDVPHGVLDEVAERTPPGEVADGLRRAARLSPGTAPADAAAALGNGSRFSSQDTVPFALWSAVTMPDDLTECLWRTVSALGDRDTNCAIAAGVVGARGGVRGVPAAWLERREPLPWSAPSRLRSTPPPGAPPHRTL